MYIKILNYKPVEIKKMIFSLDEHLHKDNGCQTRNHCISQKFHIKVMQYGKLEYMIKTLSF